jgi:eukaryotic-like serine/threonine-protein kinase
MARLSETGGGHWDTAWMPDSRRLLFSGGPAPIRGQIFFKAADGSGAATIVTPSPGGFPNAVSSDGKFMLFHRGAGELTVQPIDSSAPARSLSKGLALNGVFSPDGRWIAYQSSETGRTEIHVLAFPDAGAGRSQVSSGGGRYPLWSPDGRELFFIDAAGFLTAVTVDSQHGFSTGPPRPLFRADRYDLSANSRPFDISHDGKRFVFATQPGRRSTS